MKERKGSKEGTKRKEQPDGPGRKEGSGRNRRNVHKSLDQTLRRRKEGRKDGRKEGRTEKCIDATRKVFNK